MIYLMQILFLVLSTWANEPSSKWPELLVSIANRYSQSPLVAMKVEKTTQSQFTTENGPTYEGNVFFSKGKFRWENLKPEKSLIVFDGKFLWNQLAEDPDFPGPIEVTKTKVSKANQSQLILNAILSSDKGQGLFKVVNTKSENTEKHLIYELKPVDIKTAQVKELVLKIDQKLSLIREAQFEDDIGNKTVLKFPKVLFYSKNRAELFKYEPPKKSQVTEL